LDHADHYAEGLNPLCGDQVNVYLTINKGVVTDVGFQGKGCAISTASASLMTETIKGKNTEDIINVFEAFRRMMTKNHPKDNDDEILGDLYALNGVSNYPVRIKCAVLSWHTLQSALEGRETTSTE
jgi:nitrogen fixation NifU-like protein